MSEGEKDRRAALPTEAIALLAEMLRGGLDLVSALELIERGWAAERAQRSLLGRGAAWLDESLSGHAEFETRWAFRTLIDRVVRGDAFVDALYELFVVAPAMQTRLAKAEDSGALGRVLPLLAPHDFETRARLLPDGRIMRVFFDAMLGVAVTVRAARLEFVRAEDQIESACFGPDGESLNEDRYFPGNESEIRAEWARTIRRARIVLRLGERAKQIAGETSIEAVYGVGDEERVRVRCEPISSLWTDRWSLSFEFTPIDPGEEDREMDWLVYG